MKIDRMFTFAEPPVSPFSRFEFETYDCKIVHHRTGAVILDMPGCIMPKHWSKNARDTAISKYFRKAGVPNQTITAVEDGVPSWLCHRTAVSDATFGPEKDIRDVIARIVGHWTYAGWKNGYFDDQMSLLKEGNARAFYDEMIYMMLAQMGAPNSPQWFNTGLWWAYGIEGKPQGHYFVKGPIDMSGVHNASVEDARNRVGQCTIQSPNAYEHVQVHACFILEVNDAMLEHNGITDWFTRESRIFKYGSGSGANISRLRGAGELLSGGGTSSGVMTWMRTADYNAGAIKSGGTTRRAAKMVCLDLDHPDIDNFVGCKVEAEGVVAALVAGSAAINDHCELINHSYLDKAATDQQRQSLVVMARQAHVPEGCIQKAIALGKQDRNWIGSYYNHYTTDFNDRAYEIAPFQNANNSVRIPTVFYTNYVDHDKNWALHSRTTGEVMYECPARTLEGMIATAAWFCGDPGAQFDTTINDWNVTPQDGRINASNPCSEHMRLDNSACNLASLRVTRFMDGSKFCLDAFLHAVSLWTIALDISNTLAHLPDMDTAINTYLYRDIGLGYCDMGALLMSAGVPYDSDAGRALAAFITASLHGQAHLTSAMMAQELGAYPRFHANKDDHLRCVHNHYAAVFGNVYDYDGLTGPGPQQLAFNAVGDCTIATNGKARLRALWDEVIRLGSQHGFRNAEMTLLAPTGTIGIVMDCDTTGVEPMFSLRTHKSLVGGSSMQMAAVEPVRKGLQAIGMEAQTIEAVLREIETTGTAPSDFGRTYPGVFATAISNDPYNPAIPWEAHIKMVAAVQSFLSGGISKTINMPADATIENVRQAYRMAHDLGCKAIAIYRDQSKLSQPLNVKKAEPSAAAVPTPAAEPSNGKKVNLAKLISPPAMTARVRLGYIRVPGIDVAVGLGLGTLYLRTTRYDDGKTAEIWANYSADQGIIQALIGQLCKTANVAMQFGVPLQAIVDSWRDSNFEPNGLVGNHPNIKTCKSVINLMARLLEFHEMGDTRSLNIQPAANLTEGDDAAVTEVVRQDPKAFSDLRLTGETCPDCGSTEYVSSGTSCKKCLRCGYGGSCG